MMLSAKPVSRNQVDKVTLTSKKGRPQPNPKQKSVKADGVANARFMPLKPL